MSFPLSPRSDNSDAIPPDYAMQAPRLRAENKGVRTLCLPPPPAGVSVVRVEPACFRDSAQRGFGAPRSRRQKVVRVGRSAAMI